MQSWFIYYKLDPAAARAVEPRIRALQQALGAATGVRGRLMRRTNDSAATTLLEIDEPIVEPGAFERALSAQIAQADLPAPLVAQRRTERFEAC